MNTTVDARGLSCPEPVIKAKKALEENDTVIVIVDNETARGNVIRMAENTGCTVQDEEKGDGIYLSIRKDPGAVIDDKKAMEGVACDVSSPGIQGPNVVAITANVMGRGDDDLGDVLIRAYMHTLLEVAPGPDVLLFFNSGVKLVLKGSDVIDDIRELERRGAKILVCGTCLNYFNAADDLGAGIVSNMYDIAGAMSSAGRLVTI